MTESTVEMYRDARAQQGREASADARSVGALYQLILSIRAAEPLWNAAIERASDPARGAEIAGERDRYREFARQSAALIRDLGGSPPEDDDRGELPHDVGDIEAAADAETVRSRMAAVRAQLEDHLASARAVLAEL